MTSASQCTLVRMVAWRFVTFIWPAQETMRTRAPGRGGGDVLHTTAVSLPYRHGAYIPCPPLNCRRRFTSASSACFYVDAGHTDLTTHHAGWSSLSGDCCSSVECSYVVCSFCAIASAVPPRPQDGTVSVIVLFTIVSSCATDCKVPL